MKKMICALLALAMMLCTVAMAETIAPMNNDFNENEGTYAAAFKPTDLKDGMLNLQLLTLDQYAPEAIEKIAVGDELVIEGKTVAIATLEKDEYDNLLINGGMYKKDGYTLSHYEPDPEDDEEYFPDCWMSIVDNDYHTYTDHGTFNLPLADNVTFTDKWDMDMAAYDAGREPLTAEGIEAVTKAITESDHDIFYENNAEVVIRDGRIVEIHRDFVP